MASDTPRKYTVLTSDQWSVVIEAYKRGTMTMGEISKTYGVSVRSIQNKVKEAGATKSAGFMASSSTATAAVSMGVGAASPTSARPSKVLTDAEREQLTKQRIDQTIESAIVSALAIEHTAARCNAILADPAATGEQLQHAAAVLRSLERAVMILDRTDRVKRRALHLDGMNAAVSVVLPELPIRDLTTDEVQKLRRRQAQEDAGAVFTDDGDLIVETPIELVEDDDRLSEGCDD